MKSTRYPIPWKLGVCDDVSKANPVLSWEELSPTLILPFSWRAGKNLFIRLAPQESHFSPNGCSERVKRQHALPIKVNESSTQLLKRAEVNTVASIVKSRFSSLTVGGVP
ncbi:hypothetical protein TNCV_2690311 [Trichonephila clavipes]|uniref:Uncharacterized protein n=1 Tax=Trichonephila clavipes TaxID=2585209 RepID=A0A8X7BA73_TRICX|nr:hypothetical protein TNCV_2690311 [Trichonephila clavipes]